jgi:hypothetical protein
MNGFTIFYRKSLNYIRINHGSQMARNIQKNVRFVDLSFSFFLLVSFVYLVVKFFKRNHERHETHERRQLKKFEEE